jgi:ABC-2 type transport system permease protein
MKELLLLSRDRAGLLVLFVMPAVLVTVITLVQENVMKTMGQSRTEIVFVDHDGGTVARHMEKALSEADGVQLIKILDGKVPDTPTARRAVAKGRYQLCLVIPEGVTAAVRARARQFATRALDMEGDAAAPAEGAAVVDVYFDPAVTGGFRSAVRHLLQLMILQIEVREKMSQLSELLPAQIEKSLQTALGPMAADMAPDPAAVLNLEWTPQPILEIRASSAAVAAAVQAPNAVQQNVPAWSLFGIFFIAVPMAGSFIKERLSGVEHRMRTMPVSYATLVGGKVSAYLMVCLVQYGLILMIGRWFLPLLGTPSFETGAAPWALLAVALCAAMAAAGYGILLGTLVKSYEQASMFGPISIVIAAALGGIMVPVYVMPAPMQKISVISPLAWAQNAFLELLVRGGDLRTVMMPVALLLLFASVCIAVAVALFPRSTR